jgi:hypothetical protein
MTPRRAMLVVVFVVLAVLMPTLGAHADQLCASLRNFVLIHDIEICVPAP